MQNELVMQSLVYVAHIASCYSRVGLWISVVWDVILQSQSE